MKFGIIVSDLGDGDASYTFVDEERWEQIVALNETLNESLSKDDLIEYVGWLTSIPSDEVDRPKGSPDGRGTILKRVFTQTFSVEPVDVQGQLIGIITFP